MPSAFRAEDKKVSQQISANIEEKNSQKETGSYRKWAIKKTRKL